MPTFTDAPELNAYIDAIVVRTIDGAVVGMEQGALVMTGRAVGIVEQSRMATGRLAGSIHPTPASSSDALTASAITEVTVAADAGHAIFVEYDTVPHWPPLAPLIEWARVKGAADPRSAGFLAARAISERGTYGVHFMRDAYVTSRDEVLGLVADGIRGAVASGAL